MSDGFVRAADRVSEFPQPGHLSRAIPGACRVPSCCSDTGRVRCEPGAGQSRWSATDRPMRMECVSEIEPLVGPGFFYASKGFEPMFGQAHLVDGGWPANGLLRYSGHPAPKGHRKDHHVRC